MNKKIKLGILKESGRKPPDKRSPLSPEQCKEAVLKFKNIEIFVEKSDDRCFKDEEFEANGVRVEDDISFCDVFLGIKEVEVSRLIENKTYLFFSHTLKKQAQNQKLLSEILKKKIRLIDYECITDENSNRLIAFGFFAGIVGAYNGIAALLKKRKIASLVPAYELGDLNKLNNELETKVKSLLPAIKIVITGGGRVASGAMEVLKKMDIPQVTASEFLTKHFDKAVFVQLQSRDYHRHKKNPDLFDRDDFHHNPADYFSTFKPFAETADLLIAGAFWHPSAPKLFELEDMKRDSFKAKVIADITCDVDGSIPSTVKFSTIKNPLYDFDPFSGLTYPAFTSENFTTVMAVDNLPCELPRDASIYFGERMLKNVLPALIVDDSENIVERATIAKEGKLTKRFQYLEDYALGR
ncbi:MAG: NAD(P)-dependent oxidoreductase [Cytophagales bacterium]